MGRIKRKSSLDKNARCRTRLERRLLWREAAAKQSDAGEIKPGPVRSFALILEVLAMSQIAQSTVVGLLGGTTAVAVVPSFLV